ncbi:hypothetical protein Vadar_029032 [Vaccinium darrowii]|uniref:Uncharacterized protein n=1 Tax=Vaccinium darrowii TaxID=229202 RepID=A0ACB7X4V6_9ERIC|nr:hypothetical protein Vadar_029032 [Vaccinium darrowii]
MTCQRIFISFDAQIKGFLASCRPFIGLDACFLKGPFAGQLMHATGRDANDQIYPLCMAVVEAELKDSWVWFLENLTTIVGRPEQRGRCFMSDRQKGLIEAFKKLMLDVEHRFCLRHMYANFSKTYRGKELKDMFWGAASAYTKPEFEEHMEILKSANKDAHEWMVREVPEVWARSFYNPRSKVNRMDNNMREEFNNWIQEARDMPILTMLETIKRQLMARYVARLEYSNKFNGPLCPNIKKKLGYKIVNASGMQVIYCGGTLFEVTGTDKTCVVDIGEHTCTCKKWDVSGVPCNHACVAILTHKGRPEDYVHPYYTRKTFIKTYNYRINPLPDKTMWPKQPYDPIEPPPVRAKSGRPKKARRKGEDEPNNPFKVRKHHITLRCRQCGTFGHNKRTCKKPQEAWVKNTYYGKQKAKYSGQSSGTKRGGTRGGRTRGAGITSTLSGKAKAADPLQPQRTLKRLKKAGEGWNSSQHSTTIEAHNPPSKFNPSAPLIRNGKVVSTKSFVKSS